MPSLLPHDLCHGWSASSWLPAVIEFQLSYYRSSLNMQYAGSKQRPDSPVPTLQRPCGRSPKRRGSLRFLPPLEVRPSSVAPDPAESRGAPPPPQDPSPLGGTLGSSLRSPAEGEGHEGFPPPPEKDLESPSSTRLEALVPSRDSRARTCSPSPRAWRPDFPGAAREAP